MSRNSSGTYTLPAGNPVVSGTVIEANWANTTNDDIAAALTDSLSRSGKGSMSASLRIIDGSVSVPGLAFANETGSGAYRSAAGEWYLTVLGNNIARLRASGLTVTGDIGATTATISGNATVGGTLGVTGVATLAANPTLSAGTANAVPYLNGSKSLVSSTALTFDGSKLGVGTASPYSMLDVGQAGADAVTSLFTTGVSDLNFRAGFSNGVSGSSGTLQARVGLFYLGSGEVATIGMYRGASATDGKLTLRTVGNDRLTVDANGNVGIGTISPAQKFDVSGNAAVSGQLMAGTTTVYSDGTIGAPRLQIRAVSGNYPGGISIGDITTSQGHFFFRNPNGNIGQIGLSGTNMFFGNGSSAGAYVTANNNFLVGSGFDGFNARVNVYFAASGTAARGINVQGAGGSGQEFIAFTNSGGGGTGTITQSAGGGTNYNTSSDYRLKENIRPMKNALGVVAQLNPVTYNWKADGSEGQGFIAHELQSVVPDCVTGEKDAVRTVDVFDDEGKKIGTKEEPVYQGIDTSFLVATLAKAIQELAAKVATLEAAAK